MQQFILNWRKLHIYEYTYRYKYIHTHTNTHTHTHICNLRQCIRKLRKSFKLQVVPYCQKWLLENCTYVIWDCPSMWKLGYISVDKEPNYNKNISMKWKLSAKTITEISLMNKYSNIFDTCTYSMQRLIPMRWYQLAHMHELSSQVFMTAKQNAGGYEW